MDQTLSPSNLSFEEKIIAPSGPALIDAVQMVRQATYEFRRAHMNVDDSELPVVFSYNTPTEQIDIISQHPLHITLQVQPQNTDARVSYECDPAQEYVLIVTSYNEEEIVSRLGIVPSQEGIDTLLQIHRRIRYAC